MTVDGIIVLTFRKGGQKGGQKSGQKTTLNENNTRERIYALIKQNPAITRAKLSEELGISPSAIQKHMEKLKAEGRIMRVGSPREGQWKILK